MENHPYQEVREAVARAELLALAAETDIQREAVQKEIKRAKKALSSAFEYSTPAEQDQLTVLEDHLKNMIN